MVKKLRARWKRNKEPIPIESIVEDLKTNTDNNRYSDLFILTFAFLRPRADQKADENLKVMLQVLEHDAAFRNGIQRMFVYLINNREIETLFAKVGLLVSSSFVEELSKQIKHRILPPVPEKRSFNYLLEKTFHKKKDYIWVNEISNEEWITFFKLIYVPSESIASPMRKQMNDALVAISVKISYLGLEDEFKHHSKSTKNKEEPSPFLEQNKRIQAFLELSYNESTSPNTIILAAENVRENIIQCEQIIEDIRKNTVKNGTSLRQSYVLLRTAQLLARMRVILRFLTPEYLPQLGWENTAKLFKSIIFGVTTRNSTKFLYAKNVEMLAYQIAEHKSESGEHYITTTRNEYVDFFYSAVAGGFIIAFAALVKALLHMIKMPMFWQYFCYGLNYAIAFVTLFVTGASLATKQPTMTASALAGGLDSKKNKGDVSFKGLALTFAKVWRSQFASFAGNLIVVFPMSYLIAVGWNYLTGEHLLHTPQEAQQALYDQNPLRSLAWFYACITGVALFISGLITGFFDNKAAYSSIGSRITEHPWLKRYFSSKKLKKAGDYVAHNMGGIIGNICLGFMLGYAGLIGNFFGIPFDIRHITISTAYFGFGVAGLDNHINAYNWIWTTIGVVGIGFFNFAISFGLAFFVALKSRSVPISKVPRVARYIIRYLRRFPADFVFPPNKERKEAEAFDKKKKKETPSI
ncbi:hypothetical protein DBR32_12110 [Taibaiella sp. KBW10]|uniref:hypothetical protein n=1 Tax=Taibaiella sp. KBW10 TaxID=2153357 RepID=UPI000F59A5B7|nr:hypothetical protein [Taibaiella sp. KBW10]RQO30310.1 hypothetical protein DBR32_12110 [Taibaiella sp. KBW10]